MKKIILGVIVVALLGGAGYFLYTQLGTEASDVEGVLPAQALFYTRVNNVEEALAQLNETPVWQSLSKINYEEILQTADQPQVGLFINMFKDWSSDPQTKAIFDKFFSKEVALAVYPPKGDLSSLNINSLNNVPEILDTIFPTLYLVTRVETDVQLAELLARTTKSFGSDVQKQSSTYKDYSIQILTEAQTQISIAYVRINDLLVVGINEDSIQHSIDAYLGEKAALKTDPSLLQVFKNQDPDTDIWTYWDLGKMFVLFEDLMRTSMAAEGASLQAQKKMDQYFKDMNAFGSLGTSIVLGQLTKFLTTLELDTTQLSSKTAAQYEKCRSMDNRTVKFIPKDTMAYQWSACLDLKTYWEQTMEELEGAGVNQENITQQIIAYETMLGMSVKDDLLPSFGDEWGGYLEGIDQMGSFPLPSLALFIEVNDQNKIGALIKQFTQNPMVQLQEEQYGKTKINYVVSLPAVQPGYCFIDNFFILALNKSLLQKSVDAWSDSSQSLIANASFKEVDFGLTQKSVGVFFTELSRLVADLETVIDWSKQFLAQKDDQRDALKSGAEKKLEDTRMSQESALAEIESVQQAMVAAADEVWDIENQGLDSTAKKAEVDKLKEKQAALEADVEALREQIVELEGIVAGYEDNYVTAADRDVYFSEFVLPFLEGLKSIQSLGGYTTMSNDTMNSGLFIKM